MELYYSPASCAMSPHIVLREAGHAYTLVRVDLKTKRTEHGEDFNTINAQGAVPFLVLDNGEALTEGAAIVQYIAGLKPEAGLLPEPGTLERARVQEWLNYIATEMHKAHVPLFKDEYPDASKQIAMRNIKHAYDRVSRALEGRDYLMGERFSVADAYLFTVVNWHNFIGLSLDAWPVLVAYQARVRARPAVEAAMREEGLSDSKAA